MLFLVSLHMLLFCKKVTFLKDPSSYQISDEHKLEIDQLMSTFQKPHDVDHWPKSISILYDKYNGMCFSIQFCCCLY